MQPFITFYTPTFKRPLGLARCLASVAMQTAIRDIEQIVVVDHRGIGIDGMYGRIPEYVGAVHGQYVHVMCDDDELAHSEVVATVKAFASEHRHPPVILVGVQKGGCFLPDPPWPPVLGGIDLSSMIVRSDVWKAHADSYGRRYEGDFDFAEALYRAGHTAVLCPVMFLRGGQSHGAAEAA